MAIDFTLNQQRSSYRGDPAMPLLWYLRDHARLTGTKFGCGIGYCGACTVHLDGAAARSCVIPMSRGAGRAVTTIEWLARGAHLHPLLQDWIDEDVPQCGYCPASQCMAAAYLLASELKPTEADLATLTNLCRCVTYPCIREAIRRAAVPLRGEGR